MATPALAASAYPDDTTTSAQSAADTAQANVDPDVAAKDPARQSYYQNKLDAANAQAQMHDAQAQADQAAADRDAAMDRADQDRSEMNHIDQ